MSRLFDDQVLRGEGFRLDRLDPGDADDVTAGFRDEGTQRWLSLPTAYTPEMALAFIEEEIPAMHAAGAGLVRRIEVDERLCGVVGLKRTDWQARVTEIAFWVAPWARGQGLAGRASRLLADWALTDQEMARVVIQSATGNVASNKAALAAGFTHEGVARSAGVVHLGRVDLAVYGRITSDVSSQP
ncbi:GNAT family protein [Nocardioides sp.]|uniref:GNAT family N-acetyltransferase n=1 Tax=Nocardioides sp. TaxID=35761 RepID=UPI002C52643C|nr:GNAT family protein [Nocardioides sp.]HXH80634.1 GNAT family protein [Nocardioides sp.]